MEPAYLTGLLWRLEDLLCKAGAGAHQMFPFHPFFFYLNTLRLHCKNPVISVVVVLVSFIFRFLSVNPKALFVFVLEDMSKVYFCTLMS